MVKDKHIKEKIVQILLEERLDKKTEEELIDELVGKPIAIDVDKLEDKRMTFSDKLADKISSIVGSWPFIFGFSSFLLIWIFINVYFINNAFDPFPFVLLNLFLSCISALQAPIIMMSQNRQAKKDRIRNHNDYLIDLKSELILEELYKKVIELEKNIKGN